MYAGFPFRRVVDIDQDAIENYQAARLKAGAAPSTINQETAYLKSGFKLLWLPVPVVAQLAEDNVRQGFVRIRRIKVETSLVPMTFTGAASQSNPSGKRFKRPLNSSVNRDSCRMI